MFNRVLMISMLGLTCLVVPAHATYTYYTDTTSFDTAAAGLTLSATTVFMTSDLVATSPYGYADPTTLVDFFDTNVAGTVARMFTIPSSPGALVQHSSSDLIEITLPSAVYAFAGTFATVAGNQSTCIEPGVASFNNSTECNQNPYLGTTNTFIGIVSDTAFSTIWIGPQSGGAQLEIESYQIGSQDPTPEVGTMFGLGSGLMLLGLFRRRLRRFAS